MRCNWDQRTMPLFRPDMRDVGHPNGLQLLRILVWVGLVFCVDLEMEIVRIVEDGTMPFAGLFLNICKLKNTAQLIPVLLHQVLDSNFFFNCLLFLSFHLFKTRELKAPDRLLLRIGRSVWQLLLLFNSYGQVFLVSSAWRKTRMSLRCCVFDDFVNVHWRMTSFKHTFHRGILFEIDVHPYWVLVVVWGLECWNYNKPWLLQQTLDRLSLFTILEVLLIPQ